MGNRFKPKVLLAANRICEICRDDKFADLGESEFYGALEKFFYYKVLSSYTNNSFGTNGFLKPSSGVRVLVVIG